MLAPKLSSPKTRKKTPSMRPKSGNSSRGDFMSEVHAVEEELGDKTYTTLVR